MRALLTGELYGPLEMRFVSPEGVYYSREVDARPVEDPARGTLYVGYAKDITDQKNQTQELLEQARHDSLTQLYNNRTGKELIDRYLPVSYTHLLNDVACGFQNGNELVRVDHGAVRLDPAGQRLGPDDREILGRELGLEVQFELTVLKRLRQAAQQLTGQGLLDLQLDVYKRQE